MTHLFSAPFIFGWYLLTRFITRLGDPTLWGKNDQIVMNKHHLHIWVFPKIGVPQNRWFIMENPMKMDDLGVKPTILGNPHIFPPGAFSLVWEEWEAVRSDCGGRECTVPTCHDEESVWCWFSPSTVYQKNSVLGLIYIDICQSRSFKKLNKNQESRQKHTHTHPTYIYINVVHICIYI